MTRRRIVHRAHPDYSFYGCGGEITACGRSRARVRYVMSEDEVDCRDCLRVATEVHLNVGDGTFVPCLAHRKAGAVTTNLRAVTCRRCLNAVQRSSWGRAFNASDWGFLEFVCLTCHDSSNDPDSDGFFSSLEGDAPGVFHNCTPEGSPVRGFQWGEYTGPRKSVP